MFVPIKYVVCKKRTECLDVYPLTPLTPMSNSHCFSVLMHLTVLLIRTGTIGRMSEILAKMTGVWSLSCLHLSYCVCGTEPEVRGHHRGLSRSKVYHSPRGLGAITQILQYTRSAQLNFSLPPLFLILPNGSGKNSWQKREKQTVGCWALSHQLEISLWKDSLLLTALSTNQRAHQSPSTQSSCPLTLPAVVGLFCLGIWEWMGLLFDRSGSRTWMRSLAKKAREGEFSQLEKRHRLHWTGLAVPALHSCCWISCHIHWDMWKMGHFGGGRGAI